ncbi:hypothetical protein [Marinimicrobium sp. ARAG 43.8]|uniref:hypothetical protein n=1 Tax=Marinimicrobium sp. ARAG 43.8 TaxID=3418719 RepID=UPI003CE8AB36
MGTFIAWSLLGLFIAVLIGSALGAGSLLAAGARALLKRGEPSPSTSLNTLHQAQAEQAAFEQEQARLALEHQRELAAIRRSEPPR